MKRWEKILALALVIVLALGVSAPIFAAADAVEFSDVDPNASNAEAVAYCQEHGLMNGTGNGQFSPEGSLTRSELATVLYRIAGTPAVTGEMPFADTQSGAWYSDAVLWASQRGLVNGYGNGLFGTTDTVSREMLQVILARYAGESPAWVGDAALAVPATRAETAVALMELDKALHAQRPEEEPSQEPEKDAAKVLVAYFSATGNTQGVARHIQAVTGGDLFEIVPETPYTAADLDYNSDCRANREQNDDSARPAIAADSVVENMADYDVIFLGYPIWWGQAPKIIYTFLESYDLDGKTIVPFCTSGSSDIGTSDDNLHSSAEGASWLDGRRFSAGAGQVSVQSWVDGLGLSD